MQISGAALKSLSKVYGEQTSTQSTNTGKTTPTAREMTLVDEIVAKKEGKAKAEFQMLPADSGEEPVQKKFSPDELNAVIKDVEAHQEAVRARRDAGQSDDQQLAETDVQNVMQRTQDMQFLLSLHRASRSDKDDLVRQKLADDPGILDRLNPRDKGKLIAALGYEGLASEGGRIDVERVSEQEERLIVQILESAGNAREYEDMVRAAGGPRAVAGMLDGRQQDRFEALNERYGRPLWNLPSFAFGG